MVLTLEKAEKLRKRTSIIYTHFDSVDSDEVKWVGLRYNKSGEVVGLCEDDDGNIWWGYLYQFHTFDR